MSSFLEVVDAGRMAYRPAWDRQLELHAEVLSGRRPAGVLMFVEHPPVITVGRRPQAQDHLLVPPELLKARGVELAETDRGGDITFHGPGQLVAYPIIPLNTYKLNVHAYMRLLEEVVIGTLARFGVTGERLEGATGVWVNCAAHQGAQQRPALPAFISGISAADDVRLAKICALGIKLRRWVSLHGLALNVTTDLAYFELINACGLGRPVTSLRKLLGEKCPTMTNVKTTLAGTFREELAKQVGQHR